LQSNSGDETDGRADISGFCDAQKEREQTGQSRLHGCLASDPGQQQDKVILKGETLWQKTRLITQAHPNTQSSTEMCITIMTTAQMGNTSSPNIG
jgi:hypothetical protein